MDNDFDTEDDVPLAVIKEIHNLTDELWTYFVDADLHLETNSTLCGDQIAHEVLRIQEPNMKVKKTDLRMKKNLGHHLS